MADIIARMTRTMRLLARHPPHLCGGAQVKSHFAQWRGKDGAWADETARP